MYAQQRLVSTKQNGLNNSLLLLLLIYYNLIAVNCSTKDILVVVVVVVVSGIIILSLNPFKYEKIYRYYLDKCTVCTVVFKRSSSSYAANNKKETISTIKMEKFFCPTLLDPKQIVIRINTEINHKNRVICLFPVMNPGFKQK